MTTQTSDRLDLVVIGAGTAGTTAATKAAAAGWRVAIADDLPYGGTCALRGCDPKKILRRGAEIIDAVTLMEGKGIDPGTVSINWSDLMQHKRGFTDPAPQNSERGLADSGVQTLHGRARFTSPTSIDIAGHEYEAGHVLVATGAAPRPLRFPGDDAVIDSTDFLGIEALPRRVVFIGGGFVSFEFAHIAARAGAAVTIVDRRSRPLGQFDPDLVELLVRHSEQVGIELRRNTAVTSVERTGGGFRVHAEIDGAAEAFDADLVVHGAGRRPLLGALDLDAADVAHTEKGVCVAAHLQSTTNPRVYAAGDAADTVGMPLTPVAAFEAKVATSNMLNDRKTAPDYDGVPTAVFTVPELVRVGLLEQDAAARGIDLDVRYTDTSNWFSNYRVGGSPGAVKILVDRTKDTVVGAHMFGHGYAELVNFFGLAMKLDLTTRQLKSMTAVYPTTTSDLGSML